ncbi:hypothetical protein ACSFA8_23040 [Variovorax sp. RT4R15]|uniref:hypothetical protein n=1 Tax=Variovorax sp. RT4R15 TaxID=3443737 RepID=UPI003F44CAA3
MVLLAAILLSLCGAQPPLARGRIMGGQSREPEAARIQRGNYSNSSIPLNEKDGGDPDSFVSGNRDTGLAVKSRSPSKPMSAGSRPHRRTCRLPAPASCMLWMRQARTHYHNGGPAAFAPARRVFES